MPILHKNITAETDIHNPKWFSNANNGDYAWKNEQGNLESIDELLLPAALNFVDASVAPPTSNVGDIYVLSSGGSVNAGWGSVSLQDWVRYDGAAWNSITPQKSSLCYNENTDKLLTFDGTAWAALGGDSIYTGSDTAFTDVEITIDNTLTFKGGDFRVQGAGTSTGVTLALYDNDTTPNKTWEWLDNGNVSINQNTDFNLNSNLLTFNALNIGALKDPYIEYMLNGGIEIISTDTDGAIKVIDCRISNTNTVFQVGRAVNSNGTWNQQNIKIGKIVDNDYLEITASSFNFIDGGTVRHKFTGTKAILSGNAFIGTEDISLQGDTLLNANVNMPNLPTSSSGLSSGDVWNDSGTLKIV